MESIRDGDRAGVSRTGAGGKVTKVDTNMYKDRDREYNLGSKLLSVMITLFLEVVREVIGVF